MALGNKDLRQRKADLAGMLLPIRKPLLYPAELRGRKSWQTLGCCFLFGLGPYSLDTRHPEEVQHAPSYRLSRRWQSQPAEQGQGEGRAGLRRSMAGTCKGRRSGVRVSRRDFRSW